MARKPRVAGLFAGIGGFEIGFNKAGFKTNLLCEVNEAARVVLEANLGIEPVPDIRDLVKLPDGTDVVCAGFPCQDLSSSGQKNGIRGSRSSIVDELFRLLRANPVEWVVIENVPFMLHLRRGEAIRRIVKRLEELDYRWAYRVIDSHAFGVPHRRKRVYLVATQKHDPRCVLFPGDRPDFGKRPKADTWDLTRPIGFYWTEGTYATGLAYNAIPPLKGGSTIGIPSPPAVLFPNGKVVTPEIRDAERLQGFDADWTLPAEEAARASVRWKLVGNAVTVDVAEWLGGRIRSPKPYEGDSDTPLSPKRGWPDAAWSLGDGRYASTLSHFPVARQVRGMNVFLKHPPRLLSFKATTGFLKRARAGNLRFPQGFLEALDRHAERLSSTIP